jgi:hypothetical protein
MSRIARRVGPLATLCVGAALAAGACGGSSPTKPLSSLGPLRPAPDPGPLGSELVPIPSAPRLAAAASLATPSKTVGGIRCERNARLLFHVHTHVTVIVRGRPRAIPAGVGVWPPIGPQNYRRGQFGLTGENCLTWLSTRYADGLIHVESSVERSFVLGDFFDVWGQPLGPQRVGPARGRVTAIVDGEVWTGDPRTIPLGSHTQIQLEVGKPLVAQQTIEFPGAF